MSVYELLHIVSILCSSYQIDYNREACISKYMKCSEAYTSFANSYTIHVKECFVEKKGK